MDIREMLVESFGDSAKELLDSYPGLMSELAEQILAVAEYKYKAKTEKERHQAQTALDALQVAAVASIKAKIHEDSINAMATSAVKFAIQVVKATVLV